MTRRIDYITAEKLSRALLRREIGGIETAFDTALAEGVRPPLAATVLTRAVARIEFIAVGGRSDRRREQPCLPYCSTEPNCPP